MAMPFRTRSQDHSLGAHLAVRKDLTVLPERRVRPVRFQLNAVDAVDGECLIFFDDNAGFAGLLAGEIGKDVHGWGVEDVGEVDGGVCWDGVGSWEEGGERSDKEGG